MAARRGAAAKRNRLLFLLLRLFAAGWMAVIFLFSQQSGPQSAALSGEVTRQAVAILVPGYEQLPARRQQEIVDEAQPLVRKGAHMALYAVLAVLLLYAVGFPARPAGRRRAAALGLCLMYALFDEFHQSLVPHRGPQLADVAVDLLGALAGLLLWEAVAFCGRRILARAAFRGKSS